MENTLESKARFFAQYIGQNVVGHDCDYASFELQEISFLDCEVGLWGDWSGGTNPNLSCSDVVGISDVWLNLKPLSLISDEDAIEVAKKYWGNNYSEFPLKSDKIAHSKVIMPTMATRTDIADLLRGKGYALPYGGLSVEQQIKYGWVKLQK